MSEVPLYTRSSQNVEGGAKPRGAWRDTLFSSSLLLSCLELSDTKVYEP